MPPLKRIFGLPRRTLVFIRDPHIPWVIEQPLKAYMPKLHRLLKYGTSDPTSQKYWDGVWGEEGLSTWRTYPNLFGKILEAVSPKSRVLDVGCGNGVLLRKLAVERGCDCVGLDISSVAIKSLKEINLSGVVARLPRLPFTESCFDTVIATEVLEHIQDPSKALQEMKRTIKPGGLLICSVPNECMTTDECDEHLHDFDLSAFSNLIEGIGEFKIIDVEDLGNSRLLAFIHIK